MTVLWVSLGSPANGQRRASHGGMLLSFPDHQVEAVLNPDGKYRLYFSDRTGELVPASLASAVSLTIIRPSGKPESVPLQVGETGEDWAGNGTPVSDVQTKVVVAYTLAGKQYSNSVLFFSRSSDPRFHINLRTYPASVRAGVRTRLAFDIRNAADQKVTALDVVHERPIHLLVVSEDLAEFYHIHPQLGPDGTFDVSQTFTWGGRYRLYVDYTPHGSPGIIDSLDLQAHGPRRSPVRLVPDTKMEKTSGPFKVTLSSDKPLTAGTDLRLSFKIQEAKSGEPVRNLERYLGAWAHIMLVSQDLNEFIHAHPYEPPSALLQNPSTIDVFTGFRKPGVYRLWIQIQRRSIVTAIPFTFRVAGHAEVTRGPKVPAGAVLVTVSASGYQPSRIEAKAGKPLELAFYRTDAQNCGGIVTFPELDVSKHLPPGQTTIVTVTPRRTGSLSFACRMGMMKGQLIVR